MWRPTGSDDVTLDHFTFGFGLPLTLHFNMAVWLSLTVIPMGRSVRDGAERDSPGLPVAPFSPGGPRGPKGPGLPGNPTSPFIPIGPGGPIGPYLPGGPSGPVLPGGPRFPRFPGLPRLPLLPFGPAWQSVRFFAQIWFCSRLSSCLISFFAKEDARDEFCCVSSRVNRFSLDIASCPSENIKIDSTSHIHWYQRNGNVINLVIWILKATYQRKILP